MTLRLLRSTLFPYTTLFRSIGSIPPMRHNPALTAFPHQPSLEESLAALPFRQAPHNIEAEQALLGAMLIKDRKSTRLNSSHANISYAVFCLKKNNLHVLQLC